MAYITRSGDHWDTIAKLLYGSELYADFLMANNPEHISIVRFEAGTILNVPAVPSAAGAKAAPPWRQ